MRLFSKFELFFCSTLHIPITFRCKTELDNTKNKNIILVFARFGIKKRGYLVVLNNHFAFISVL